MKDKQIVEKGSLAKKIFDLMQYIRSLQLNHQGVINIEKLKTNINKIYVLQDFVFSSESDYIHKQDLYTIYTDWGGKHCIINPMLNEFITISGSIIQYNHLYDVSSFKPVYNLSMTDCKNLSINMDIKYSSTLNCMYQLLVGRLNRAYIKSSNSKIIYKFINQIKTIKISKGDNDIIIFSKINI